MLAELAMAPAIEDVDDEPERQPKKETNPSDDGQARHQSGAKHHGNQWEKRHQRHPETTRAAGLPAAENDYPERNQHEGKERPNVGKVRRVTDVHESGGEADRGAGDPRGPARRLVTAVHSGEKTPQEAVA